MGKDTSKDAFETWIFVGISQLVLFTNYSILLTLCTTFYCFFENYLICIKGSVLIKEFWSKKSSPLQNRILSYDYCKFSQCLSLHIYFWVLLLVTWSHFNAAKSIIHEGLCLPFSHHRLDWLSGKDWPCCLVFSPSNEREI